MARASAIHVASMYLARSPLTDTGDKTWADGAIWHLDLSKDTFVHFTPADRAAALVASGKLLQRPPFKKMGGDAVYAVSTVWGHLVPRTQTTHYGNVDLVGIVFKTSTPPKYGYSEEVVWDQDVKLQGAKIVPFNQAVGLLRSTPHRIAEDDMVTYGASAMRVAQRWLSSPGCPAHTQRTACTLLPVSEPLHNFREMAKQMVLLEDHLFQPRKRCMDCIRKHLLTIEALAEEIASLASADMDPKWVIAAEMYAEVARMAQVNIARGEDLLEIARAWRQTRKVLVDKLYETGSGMIDMIDLTDEQADEYQSEMLSRANAPRVAMVARVAARYQNKKKVKTQDGDEVTVYEYSEGQVQHRNREKAKRIESLRNNIADLRSQVTKDLGSSDPETRLVALAVALLDDTYERVGNEDSAKDGHFGVTGWKVEHVKFSGDKATFTYVGKSGVDQKKTVTDSKIVSALKAATKGKKPSDDILCDTDGTCRVTSTEVNAYLEPHDITAKDIRGLHANEEMRTRLKAVRSKGGTLPEDKKKRDEKLKAEFKTALEGAAEAVGHEPSTLKSQYLVPGLEDAFLKDGKVPATLDKTGSATVVHIGRRAFDVLKQGRIWTVRDKQTRQTYSLYWTAATKRLTERTFASQVVLDPTESRDEDAQVFPIKQVRIEGPDMTWTSEGGTQFKTAETLGPNTPLMEMSDAKVKYRVRSNRDGIGVSVYYGRTKIGGMNAFVKRYPEQESCGSDVWKLLDKFPQVEDQSRERWTPSDGEERTNTRALQVYKAFITDETKHGMGIGKAMYLALMAEWFKKVGPFLFMPMSCGGASGTSSDAKRVWASLSRQFPSSGDVVAVLKRPALPAELKLGGLRTAGVFSEYAASKCENDHQHALQLAADAGLTFEEWQARSAERVRRYILATKTQGEKDDEDAEHLIRRQPKAKPPRTDLHNRLLDEDENDEVDRKANRVAFQYLLRLVARRDKNRSFQQKKKNERKQKQEGSRPADPKAGDTWTDGGKYFGVNPKGTTKSFDKAEKATAFAKGKKDTPDDEPAAGKNEPGSAGPKEDKAPTEDEAYSPEKVKERAKGLKEYTKLRDYTDEELANESDEYFENDYTVALAPDAFKSPEALRKLIKDAKPKVLTDDEYARLGERGDTDSLGILMSDNPKEAFREIAKGYGRDADRVEKGFTDGDAMPPPVVLKDSKGQLYLLAGNTRMMGAAAMGVRMPVKMIEIKGEFDTKAAAKMMAEDEGSTDTPADTPAKKPAEKPVKKPAEKPAKKPPSPKETLLSPEKTPEAAVDQTVKEFEATLKDDSVPKSFKKALTDRMEDMSEEEAVEFSQAFDLAMVDVATNPPEGADALKKGRAALEVDFEKLSPKSAGKAFAAAIYADRITFNPLNLGGKMVSKDTDPASEEDKAAQEKERRARGEKAYDHYKGMKPGDRKRAMESLMEARKGLNPDSPRAREIDAIHDGVALSAMLFGDNESTPGREISKQFGDVVRLLAKSGNEKSVLGSLGDFTSIEGQRMVRDSLEALTDEELTDLVGGEDGPWGGIVKAMFARHIDPDTGASGDYMVSEEQRDKMREQIREAVVDTISLMDPLVGEILEANGLKNTPEAREAVIRESHDEEALNAGLGNPETGIKTWRETRLSDFPTWLKSKYKKWKPQPEKSDTKPDDEGRSLSEVMDEAAHSVKAPKPEGNSSTIPTEVGDTDVPRREASAWVSLEDYIGVPTSELFGRV